MNETTWILLLIALTGAGGRLAKLYPRLPKGLMPVLSLVLGAGIYLAKACLLDGLPLTEALACWQVILTGAGAIVGHDLLKPVLVKALGEQNATLILGKLAKPKPPEKPKAPPSPAATLFVTVALAIVLSGCSLLSQLAGSQWLSSALDLASAGSKAYFDRHPSLERQQAIADAYLDVLRAQAAYDGDRSPEHKAAVVDAYRAYLELLTEHGIRSAQGPVGGAEGNAPLPQPLDPTGKRLPTPEELAEAL